MAASMFLPANSFTVMQSVHNAVPGRWPRKCRMACRVPPERVITWASAREASAAS